MTQAIGNVDMYYSLPALGASTTNAQWNEGNQTPRLLGETWDALDVL